MPPEGGGVVRLTSGKYYIGPQGGTEDPTDEYSLKISSNTHLLLDQDTVLVRRFAGGGLTQATIVNKGGAAANSKNIRVSGGTITTEGMNEDFQGKHLGFVNVTALSVDDIRFPAVYMGWTAFFRDCHDVTISNLVIGNRESFDDELQDDGLHFAGGSRILVTNCVICTGDDCIALVHEGYSGEAPDARPETDLTDFALTNCSLLSVRAHPIRIQIVSTYDGTKTISKVRMSNIVAKAGMGLEGDIGSAGIRIADEKSGVRLISDISIDGVTLDCSENTEETGNGYPLVVLGVDRVQLTGIRISKPSRYARIDDSNDIELRDCSIDAPGHDGQVANQSCLRIASTGDCRDVRILGGWYRDATEHGIHVGSDSYAVTGFQICNTLVEGADVYGILIHSGTNGLVSGNTVRSGADRGIYELTLSDLNTYIGNLLTTASSTYPLIDLPSTSQSEAIRNVAITKKLDDTGGFRQTIDGWVNAAALQSTYGPVEMARNNFPVGSVTNSAGRFRVVRPGSITGLVITITAPGGSVTGLIRVHVQINNTSTYGSGYTGYASGFNVTLVAGSLVAADTPIINQYPFAAGDEIFLLLETIGWSDTSVNVRCALEIED